MPDLPSERFTLPTAECLLPTDTQGGWVAAGNMERHCPRGNGVNFLRCKKLRKEVRRGEKQQQGV